MFSSNVVFCLSTDFPFQEIPLSCVATADKGACEDPYALESTSPVKLSAPAVEVLEITIRVGSRAPLLWFAVPQS